MNKKISVSVALSITLIAMTLTFAMTMVFAMRYFDSHISSTLQRQVLNNKVAELDKIVRNTYYGNIDEDYLGDRTARGYIDGLRDPNCVYYTAKEYAELQQIENGTRLGIGVELVQDANGYYYIAKVHPDSPALAAGVTSGGVIRQVDGVDAKTYTSVRSIEAALMGDEGSEVTILCLYGTEEQSFTMQRVAFSEETVEPLQVVDGFAYIRIAAFDSTTPVQFERVLGQAQDEGAMGIVFDLRGVSGGSYDQAYLMIDALCPVGTIVKSERKDGTLRTLSTSDEENKVELPMVVVVNGGTGGPAELFALSIRELAGGQIVGSQTAGLGMQQSAPQQMVDGSAVVLTVGKLQTGQGFVWDGVGVTPDIPVSAASDDALALFNIDPRTDPQVVRAIDLARSLAKAAGIDVSVDAGTGDDDAASGEPASTADTPLPEGGTSDVSSSGDGGMEGDEPASTPASTGGTTPDAGDNMA